MKSIRLLFSSLLLLVLCNVCIAQQYDFEVDNLYYKVLSLEDNTVKVVSNGEYSHDYRGNGNITIPEFVLFRGRSFRVTEIDNGAFMRGRGLHTVYMPNSIVSMGQYAFFECQDLYTFSLSENLSVIPHHAFSPSCRILDLSIPSNVVAIGEEARIGTREYLTFEMSDVPLEVFYGAFSRNNSIFLSRNLVNKENRPTFIYFCDKMTIDDNVTSILSFDEDSYSGNGRYIYGPTLSDITFGASLKQIPSFKQAKTLESITVRATTPPSAEGFPEIVYMDATLYVPIGTKSLYEKAEIWGNFLKIEETEIYNYIRKVEAEEMSAAELFGLMGDD